MPTERTVADVSAKRIRMSVTAALVAVCAAALLLPRMVSLAPAAATETQPGVRNAVIIPIKGEINEAMADAVRKSLDDAKGKADAVVLVIDTPGGEGGSVSQISQDIRDLSPVPSIAFVSNWAAGAGALIALSCDRVYVAPRSVIGAARGYVPGPDGLPMTLPKDIDEKFRSFERAQIRTLASEKGYPVAIAEAMVDETLGVKKVTLDGKTLYMADDEVEQIQSDPARKDKLTVIETVVPKGRLLAMTAAEAVKYGVAKQTANSIDDVLKVEGLTVAPAAPAASPAGSSTVPASATAPGRSTLGQILVVSIEGEIDRTQGAYLYRAVKDAKGRVDAVIFVLDTPGGRSDIMAEMSREILDLSPTPTIALVDTWAASAGAFIAMSCDRIYMAPSSVIGSAKGYLPGPDGVPIDLPKSIEEKFASFGRAEFRALAQAKGYPAALAEAMADETLGVTKVIYDGRTQYMTGDKVGQLQADPLTKGKLRVLEVVLPKGRLLALTAEEAVKYDIARKVVAGHGEAALNNLLRIEGLEKDTVLRVEQNWSDRTVAILTSPEVVGLLILIGFAGIWLEIKMAGFGLPGTIAVLAFLTVFASQFLVGNANALDILVFLIGMALIGIEVFVTPGFGVMGGLGIALVIGALLMAMQPFAVPSEPWQFQTLGYNLVAVLSGLAGSFLVLLVAIWLLPATPGLRRFTLQKQLKVEEGFSSGVPDGAALVGQVGTVIGTLRPAGRMQIGDEVYSVVSDGGFVEPGMKARVLYVDGPKIVVVPIEPPKAKEPEFRP